MDKKIIGIISVMLIMSLLLLYVISKPTYEETIAYKYSSNYVERYFDKNKVIDIYITLSESDFNNMMLNPTKEEYKQANIIIDGTKIDYVGFRVKGNSSLNMVANSDSERFSFKIDFDQYIKGQTLDGLTKLNLNNSISDPSYMREYLSYSLLNEMGVPTPAFCYVNVYVNDELIGLYLAVEGIEEPFIERYYSSNDGTLYKPEGQGSDLVFIDDNINSYSGIKVVTDIKKNDQIELINMLKALNTGENLEQHLNIDGILRYFAVNTVLVNMDSYQGNLKHNYYLYEEDGVFSILPWDYNMSFAGFNMGMNTQHATSLYIDNPVSGTTLEQRPLLGRLLEVEEYKILYHKYIDEFINGPFSYDTMSKEIEHLANMIRPYLEKDPTKFYTIEQFEDSLLDGSYNENLSQSVDNEEMNRLRMLQAEDVFNQSKIPIPNEEKNRQINNKNMINGNVIGLEKFILDRIDNVSMQIYGEIPSYGDNNDNISGERDIMAFQNRPDRNIDNERLLNGTSPMNMDKTRQNNRINQQNSNQLDYILGGSILIFIIVLLAILKKKTKYMI